MVHEVRDPEVPVVFEVDQTSMHGTVAVPGQRRGIHPTLLDEVDSLLRMGVQPEKVRLVPTSKQLENRKAFLVRSADGWEITNHATFTGWASSRVCSTQEEFQSVTDFTDTRMDDMIVLDAFTVAVSSRRVFRNIVIACRDQVNELVCATDGTYKLHFGGWTLVDRGSTVVTWSLSRQLHTLDRARQFLQVEVNVKLGSLDHSEAIASAFLSIWPEITLITCWPHLVRQLLKKKSLLRKAELFDEMVKPDVYLLKAARTHLQFEKLAIVITDNWTAPGENTFAQWFKDIYLTQRWSRWHINGAATGGVTPSQQGIESHRYVSKKTCAPSSRASTSGELDGILPRILKSDGETLCRGHD
ncbi:hypothetical protein P3T76_007339 [Phytophthora citrophthora]|uniref:MULE transposase domain-containing protein n=1 Tax=Phytophthora citrophthora TaxID=4793 RepID=A0AAD9GNK1_9STRA|nr:hypothetical protein P3T76_007339 [Phytophthora citrophthora]